MLWPKYCITKVNKDVMTKVLYYKSKQRCITKYYITKVNKNVLTKHCITKVKKHVLQSIVLQK